VGIIWTEVRETGTTENFKKLIIGSTMKKEICFAIRGWGAD